MTPRRAFIIVPGQRAWHVLGTAPAHAAEVPIGAEELAAQIVPRVVQSLRTSGWRDESVLLALPSNWCLAAQIDAAGLPRGDRSAMLFRLEEKLPLAAEQVVADFAPAAGGERR